MEELGASLELSRFSRLISIARRSGSEREVVAAAIAKESYSGPKP